VEPVVFEEHPSLDRPVLIVAFRGWNDAGDAASTALEFASRAWSARRFARIDPEEFFDFQVTRPTVRLVEGTTRRITWPAPEFSFARAAGRDVILLQGAEPNFRWKSFATAIVETARGLGATRLVTLGAFLADVAHTRAVPIVGSASTPEEAERLHLSPSNYEGPTGIVGVTHDVANRMGLPSVSFWAAVPHYLPVGENPKAALALADRLASFLNVALDTSDLAAASAAWEQTVTEHVRENRELAEYLERLEEVGTAAPAGEAGGSELAEEIERYLRERSGGGDE
jgi:predicted ATP-grasp superfamily ATP-dependent carboligase